MSIALLQEKIRARKTPLALVLGPEADKLPARITKNFTDMYGPGDMAQAEALRYHGSQLISHTSAGEKYQAPDGSWQTRGANPPMRDPRCP